MIRSPAKRNETKAFKTLIKNGKYFVSPGRDASDFKVLFKRSASAGAGRPVDTDGFPQGVWTPDLLAEAISEIDANRSGIELRTVQLWFQDNEKGISSDNIRWLARIFGCDDPEVTGEWQTALSAAQSRLTAKRRQKRQPVQSSAQNTIDAGRSASIDDGKSLLIEPVHPQVTKTTAGRSSLALRSEAIFGRGSPLDLPASAFAGAVALGFFSYFLSIHSVEYAREDGIIKQVGFLWAPNWTLLFMVFLPLFFAFAVETLAYWKNEGRSKLLAASGVLADDAGWARKVEGSSYTYWAVFLICLAFAGLFQWIGVCLLPLLNGGGDYSIDWGSMAILRPDIISIQQAVAFTGFAYLYMCLCFYLLFVGLILLYTLAHDFDELAKASEHQENTDQQSFDQSIAFRILRGIFRCCICVMLIAISMKLQTSYLTTNSESVLQWLVDDSLSILPHSHFSESRNIYSSPTHYSSFLVALATCAVFFYGSIRVGSKSGSNRALRRMAATMIMLAAGYLLVGTFSGFSFLLGAAVLLAFYGLFDPRFGIRPVPEPGGSSIVS